MPFTPQTKRYELKEVPLENNGTRDVMVYQDEYGDCALGFALDMSNALSIDKERYPFDVAIIAALGFPTEGEEA